MAYGLIKVDTVTFTNNSVDQTISVSGIIASISGNLTVTGTISGSTVQATYGTFTSLTGVTTSGTNANFQTITGATGVFTTSISGATVIAPTGTFTSLTGTTATFTSGIIASGTAALPSLAILSDPNTGIFSPGADQLAVATNGTSRLSIDASGNVAVDTNTLYVDAVNNRVAIGTTSPNAALDVRSATAWVGDGTTDAFLQFNQSATAANRWHIGAGVDNALLFYKGTYGTGVETARIDSSGRLLVGTSSTSGNITSSDKLAVVITGDSTQGGISVTDYAGTSFTVGSYAALRLQRSIGTTDGSFTALTASSWGLGRIEFNGSNGVGFGTGATIEGVADTLAWGNGDHPARLVFSTTADGGSTPTERMRIDSAGRAEFTCVKDNNAAVYILHNGTNGTQYGIAVNTANDQNDSTRYFLNCTGASTVRAVIRADGGLANYSANNANLSDINTKKDISPAAGTWDCLKEWEIVNYRYKDQLDDAGLNLGVIAQQVAESCPEVITVFEEAKGDQPEKLGVKEQQMYWMAIKALQEAMGRIETLEQRLTAAGID